MSQQRSNITHENIRAKNLDIDTATARESIRYPVQLIIPIGPVTTITLSNENSGNIIDANTLATQYRITIHENAIVGDRWEVYINSENIIIFGNDTGRDLVTSGVTYAQDGLIGGYEFIPLLAIPPNTEIHQSGNKARYQVTVTDVTNAYVRIAFHAIFIISI